MPTDQRVNDEYRIAGTSLKFGTVPASPSTPAEPAITELVDLSSGAFKLGTVAGTAPIKGIYSATAVAVTVPSITDPDSASVDVDVSGAFTVQPAVGDLVLVCPEAALPTNAFLSSAYLTATDTVRMVFTSIGGSVTGAARNFTVMVLDVT